MAALTSGGSIISHAQTGGLAKIEHVVVIYQENWSFDGLYGRFPGADGLANAGATVRQVQKDGAPHRAVFPHRAGVLVSQLESQRQSRSRFTSDRP